MIEQIRQSIIEAFIEMKDDSVEAISAANLAFYDILSHKSLGGLFDHVHMIEAGPSYWRTEIVAYENGSRNFDVMQPCYRSRPLRNGSFFELEMPEVFSYGNTNKENGPYEGNFPSLIEDLAESLLNIAEGKSDLLKTIRHAPHEVNAAWQEVTLTWVNQEQAQKELLKYSPNSWRVPEEGLSFGVSYFHIKDHDESYDLNTGQLERKNWYLLAQTPLSLVGAACIVERPMESSFSLPYLSVAPGMRGKGISLKMMDMLVDKLQDKNYWLKRSQPSEFAQSQPQITDAYTRLLESKNVVYATMHTELESKLASLSKKKPFVLWKQEALLCMSQMHNKGEWMSECVPLLELEERVDSVQVPVQEKPIKLTPQL